MEWPLPDGTVERIEHAEFPLKKKRGRPKRDLNLASINDGASSSSAGNSAPPTPSAQPVEDPLAADEYAAFGVTDIQDPLPPAPVGAGMSGSAYPGGPKRSIEAAMPSAPLGRAKRPKNVKFSPAKTGKALARRSIITATGQMKAGGADGEVSLPNNDFCDACNGKGHFLCCDGGCLRSFHFACLEPPLEVDDVPDEAWYCKACRAAKNPPPKPPRGFFQELIHRVDCENPKTFCLPAELKNFFKNVATGPGGDFIDSSQHRPPSKITGRAVGQEDRDPFRLKDKLGRTMLCYQCGLSASLQKKRKIISCDFCEQHWHLDCLDPPMSGMPPPTRKWMCPLHSDHVMPKKRLPKQTTTIPVQEPGIPNNGDIVIVAKREPPRPVEDHDEVTVNRVRYQVPEEMVVLDFWAKASHGGTQFGQRSPERKTLHQQRRAAQDAGSRGTSPYSIDSPLTSLGDMSDADPPHRVSRSGGNPKSGPRLDTRALESLAILAEGYYENLIEDQQRASQTPLPSSASRAASNGLVASMPPRNGASSANDSSRRYSKGESASSIPMDTSSGSDAGRTTTRDKGKGKAVEPYQSLSSQSSRIIKNLPPSKVLPHTESSSASPSQARSGHSARRPPAAGGWLAPERRDRFDIQRAASDLSSPIAAIPPYRPRAAPAPPFDGRVSAGSSSTKRSESPVPELQVQSRDDLKALMHVRKLISGTGANAIDSATRQAMYSFLEGDPVVPKLPFMEPGRPYQPWELPWESNFDERHLYRGPPPPVPEYVPWSLRPVSAYQAQQNAQFTKEYHAAVAEYGYPRPCDRALASTDIPTLPPASPGPLPAAPSVTPTAPASSSATSNGPEALPHAASSTAPSEAVPATNPSPQAPSIPRPTSTTLAPPVPSTPSTSTPTPVIPPSTSTPVIPPSTSASTSTLASTSISTSTSTSTSTPAANPRPTATPITTSKTPPVIKPTPIPRPSAPPGSRPPPSAVPNGMVAPGSGRAPK